MGKKLKKVLVTEKVHQAIQNRSFDEKVNHNIFQEPKVFDL